MAGVAESNRQRIAFILLGIGGALVLLGFGLLVLSPPGPEFAPATHPSSVPAETKARALRQMLFWMLVLVLIFVVSTSAFLRWSRSFRRSLLRKPHQPTPSDDVWAMHKLPEGALEQWTDSDPEEEPGQDPPSRP